MGNLVCIRVLKPSCSEGLLPFYPQDSSNPMPSSYLAYSAYFLYFDFILIKISSIDITHGRLTCITFLIHLNRDGGCIMST